MKDKWTWAIFILAWTLLGIWVIFGLILPLMPLPYPKPDEVALSAMFGVVVWTTLGFGIACALDTDNK